MFGVVRSQLAKALWLAWPVWVGFAVISTGNHYWLDVVAGFVLALATGSCSAGLACSARGARDRQEPAPEPRVSQLDRVKQEYTQAARRDPRSARCAASRRRS